jgi:predicted enzyme related to lactoylglutathione lyase
MAKIDTHEPGSFCWLELGTTDQGAAHSFYPALFNWKFNQFPMGPNEFYTIFQLEGADCAAAYTLRADQTEHGVPPHWMPYVAVTSADETAAKAAQLAGKVLAPPFDVMDFGRMAVLQDPAGATFSIWEAKSDVGTRITGQPGTLCWADLNTPDAEGAKAFYGGLFGWKITPGEKDPSGYLHIQNGETMIGGVPPANQRPPNVPPHWLLYFEVSDVDSTAAEATRQGGTLPMPPLSIENVGRLAVVADPQGAVFAIFKGEEKSH